MNILYLYTGMNVGGAQRVIVNLMKEMKNNNTNCILVSCEGKLLEELKQVGIKNYILPLKSKKPFKIIDNIKKIISICKSEQIDIIHSHHRFTTFISYFVSKFCKIELVHTEHNVFPDKNWINIRGKNIIAVSNMVKNSLISHNVNEDYIQVIYNGINTEISNLNRENSVLKEFDLEKTYVNIGVIARYSKQKGQIFLLEAIRELINQGYKFNLLLIGEGEERSNLEKYISENDLSKRVKLTGNREDIANIINELDFFVLPSVYEGLPVSILEIMSQGKIIIATDVGGNKEVISDGQNGYLIKSGDTKMLIETLKYVYNNLGNLSDMEERARREIRENFSLRSMIENHIEYYNNLFNKQ